LQIDKDGAIGAALSPCPIIHAQHLRLYKAMFAASSQETQDCIAADRHAQPIQQTGSSFSA
jgi:hypothetical protein